MNYGHTRPQTIVTDIHDPFDLARVEATRGFYRAALATFEGLAPLLPDPVVVPCPSYDVASAAEAVARAARGIPGDTTTSAGYDEKHPAQAREITQTLDWRTTLGGAAHATPATGGNSPAYVVTAVVDPGVGSRRKAVIRTTAGDGILIGPSDPERGDLFALAANNDPIVHATDIDVELFRTLSHLSAGAWEEPPVVTFDFRTVFDPAREIIACGVAPSDVNVICRRLLRRYLDAGARKRIERSGQGDAWRGRLARVDPEWASKYGGKADGAIHAIWEGGALRGRVADLTDRFGNVVLALEAPYGHVAASWKTVWIDTPKGALEAAVARTFADLAGPGAFGLIRGSKVARQPDGDVAGYPCELVLREGDARAASDLEPGDPVTLRGK